MVENESCYIFQLTYKVVEFIKGETEMNYEEKYKEALEWMRSIYPTMQGADKEDAEHYFPELRESEDERIRKEIIELVHFFYCSSSVYEHHVSEDDMIAWLEKQGEKKPSWSEEDERILNKIQDNLREFYVNKKGYPYVAEPDSPEMMENNWLKFLKDRLQPQPKQEWSEEDIEIIKMIEDCLSFYKMTHCVTLPSVETCIEWLKSIKPNHWKPSEEQMKGM